MNAKNIARFSVYAVLGVAAFFFLAPLYVMLVTSFKDAEQIRSGNLLSLPDSLNFESWTLAWSTACTGVDCRGLQPYFWNSVSMAVPAVLRSIDTWQRRGQVESVLDQIRGLPAAARAQGRDMVISRETLSGADAPIRVQQGRTLTTEQPWRVRYNGVCDAGINHFP